MTTDWNTLVILPNDLSMIDPNTVPNYWETLFEYQDLSPIHSEPTYESLHKLVNQFKANACSVHTTLGGGQYGHLGFILTPQQNCLLSPIPTYDLEVLLH